MLSTPAFSTPVIWCRVFHSRVLRAPSCRPNYNLLIVYCSMVVDQQRWTLWLRLLYNTNRKSHAENAIHWWAWPHTTTTLTSETGRNSNTAVSCAASKAFLRWLRHRRGPCRFQHLHCMPLSCHRWRYVDTPPPGRYVVFFSRVSISVVKVEELSRGIQLFSIKYFRGVIGLARTDAPDILPGPQERDGVPAHTTVADRTKIWQKHALPP